MYLIWRVTCLVWNVMIRQSSYSQADPLISSFSWNLNWVEFMEALLLFMKGIPIEKSLFGILLSLMRKDLGMNNRWNYWLRLGNLLYLKSLLRTLWKRLLTLKSIFRGSIWMVIHNSSLKHNNKWFMNWCFLLWGKWKLKALLLFWMRN